MAPWPLHLYPRLAVRFIYCCNTDPKSLNPSTSSVELSRLPSVASFDSVAISDLDAKLSLGLSSIFGFDSSLSCMDRPIVEI